MANHGINQPDYTHMPARLLVKALFVKAGRRVKRLFVPPARMTWTVQGVSDADGPTANVRNYNERRTIRSLLTRAADGKRMKRACEVGCGYGRLVMTLKEFADEAVGFEREPHLVEIAQTLLPDVSIVRVESLDKLPDPKPFDFAMTCTVLQHLTDEHARNVCAEIRRLVPKGHVLLIEKTEAISITENTQDESSFISRARSVETYAEFMAPYRLVHTQPRIIEPTYHNPRPGTCMLFQAP
jgi:trans-aconitate methyltransferase